MLIFNYSPSVGRPRSSGAENDPLTLCMGEGETHICVQREAEQRVSTFRHLSTAERMPSLSSGLLATDVVVKDVLEHVAPAFLIPSLRPEVPSQGTSFAAFANNNNQVCFPASTCQWYLQERHKGDTPRSKDSNAERCPEVTREALEALYHLPIDQASRCLGIGITALKKSCRKFGIPRWPHRKLKSMEKLLQDIITVIPEEKAHKVACNLVEEHQKIRQEPAVELGLSFRKMRQSSYKFQHKHRRCNPGLV